MFLLFLHSFIPPCDSAVSSSVAFACCLARSTLSSTKPLLLLCFCFLDAHAASYHVLLAAQVKQHLLAIPSSLPLVGAAVQSIFRRHVNFDTVEVSSVEDIIPPVLLHAVDSISPCHDRATLLRAEKCDHTI